MAESKKIGRGKNQASRQAYKACKRDEINKTKRAKKRETWSTSKDQAEVNHGQARRTRREAWRNANPNKPFAAFEKRDTGLSKWDSDRQLPKTITTLSTDNINLLKSLQNVRSIKLAA